MNSDYLDLDVDLDYLDLVVDYNVFSIGDEIEGHFNEKMNYNKLLFGKIRNNVRTGVNGGSQNIDVDGKLFSLFFLMDLYRLFDIKFKADYLTNLL